MVVSSQGGGELAFGFLPQPGESVNLRGETVAKKEKVHVQMLTGCRGEKTLDEETGTKEQLRAGEDYYVSKRFAASLFQHGRAEAYDEDVIAARQEQLKKSQAAQAKKATAAKKKADKATAAAKAKAEKAAAAKKAKATAAAGGEW